MKLSEVTILVVDTSKVAAGTFIKDLEIMEAFAGFFAPADKRNLQRLLNLRTKDDGRYHFGEYLSQGSIIVRSRCVSTTLLCLIKCGLFDVGYGLEKRTLCSTLA